MSTIYHHVTFFPVMVILLLDRFSHAEIHATSVADLVILRGGFSFTKKPAKLEVKTEKRPSPAFPVIFHPHPEVKPLAENKHTNHTSR